jgi:hypothetical protein
MNIEKFCRSIALRITILKIFITSKEANAKKIIIILFFIFIPGVDRFNISKR